MSLDEYRAAILKFKEKLGQQFVEQVERSLGKDLDELVHDNPRLVLERMLTIVYRRYVLPFEISKDIEGFLYDKFHISNWKLALSERYLFNPNDHADEIGAFIESYYSLANRLGVSPKTTYTGDENE